MLEFAKCSLVPHAFLFLKQNIHRGLSHKFSYRVAAARPWRTSKTSALWALWWTGIRRGTNCLIKLWIVCVSSPSSFVKPQRKKKKEKRGCKKRWNLRPSVKGSSAWKGFYMSLMWTPACCLCQSYSPLFFTALDTGLHRRLTFLLLSHIGDSLCFSNGQINVAVTLYSKTLSPSKEIVPLSRHPVILQRVRMYKLVLRKSWQAFPIIVQFNAWHLVSF